MSNNRQPNPADQSVGLGRIIAVFEELALDYVRAVRGAVPCALRAQLVGTLDDDRLDDIADAILLEVALRYRVASGATTLAIGAHTHETPPTKREANRDKP